MAKARRKVKLVAEAQGWTLVRDGHHTIYRCPKKCGQHQVVTSSSTTTPVHFAFKFMRKCDLWDRTKES